MSEHNHNHEHSHSGSYSHEEALALLTYMVGHNKHHAEELHDLAHCLDGDVAQLIHDAIVDYSIGNEKLDDALSMLKGE